MILTVAMAKCFAFYLIVKTKLKPSYKKWSDFDPIPIRIILINDY